MKKEKLINNVLNLYSATNNVFFEDHYLRRRITRRENEFLLKRNIAFETPLELVKNNVERYVNIFYADFISDEKTFDKYTDKQKYHLIELNNLIKKSKDDTIDLITNEFARIFSLNDDYIQSASFLEKSLTKIVDEFENEITNLSGQIKSCMLLWDYEKKGYYTYKLIANDGCCEECEKLNGKEFLIKDFNENVFFPVVHPNCRCEIFITDENSNVVTNVNDKSNKTENVSVLDEISNFLAIASLIPGFDTFTDLVSIPVDLLKGDFLSAGLDVIGVIPFVGEIADTTKIINKADKAIDIINKQKRGTPRNNKAQNKQTGSIAKKLKLTPKQQRELHDLIHGQNWGYQEILDFAKSWFNK